MFGFRSMPYRLVVNWLERLKMTEIRMICSDFRHFLTFESRTIGRSTVRFSDTLLGQIVLYIKNNLYDHFQLKRPSLVELNVRTADCSDINLCLKIEQNIRFSDVLGVRTKFGTEQRASVRNPNVFGFRTFTVYRWIER